MPRSFRRDGLPPAANLATAAAGRRLRRLAAGVGVDLGVEHQDVDVAARGEHVVQAAEADVVGPAVAADDPDAAADQRRRRSAPASWRRGESSCRQPLPQRRDPLPLLGDLRLGSSGAFRAARRPASSPSSPASRRSRLLGVVLLAGRPPAAARGRTRRCPRTASWTRSARGPSAFVGPGRRRQVAAVDRRAAGRVGDQHPVAEELGHQLHVGRLAAAGTGAGELEQRLAAVCEPLTVSWLDRVAVELGDRQEEVEVRPLALQVVALRLHVDRLVLGDLLALAPGRRRRRRRSRCSRPARPGWSSASRASPCPSTVGATKPLRRARQRPRPGTAFMRIAACGQTSAHRPHWMQISGSQIGISWAMLRFSNLRGAGGKRAVDRHRADRQQRRPGRRSWPGVTPLDERRGDVVAAGGSRRCSLVTCSGTFTSCRAASARVDRGEVPLHHRLAPLAVGLLDRVLDLGDRLLLAAARRPARRSRSA